MGVCPVILQPARKKTPWINLSKLLDLSPCTNIILAKTLEIDTSSISLPKFQLFLFDVKQSVKNRMLKQGVACCRSLATLDLPSMTELAPGLFTFLNLD